MEHLLMKAAVTTATDKGEFTAVISAASIDRERDIVDPAGFVRALQKWVPLGKKLPLAWNHSGRPEDQIGYVDPASVHVQGSEVVASGKMDLESPNGAHAWRCVKAGTLGFSFGYLVPAGGSTKRKGGGRHIHELDVFEVTATPTPMNADTRVLDYKAIKGASTVGPAARHHLGGLIKYYMGKPHPFGACVKDNTKRFGPDGADRVCLAGDTPVSTADGEVPIADLRVGDLVWSYSESTGRFELKPVVWHGLSRRNATVVRIRIEDGPEIVATPDHPFLRYNGEWADAGCLRAGEFLLGPAPSGVFAMAGAAEPLARADSALAKADLLGPQMAPSTARILALSAPTVLNLLMSRDDLSDLRAPAAGHQRLNDTHNGDGCVPVDLPLVVGPVRAVGLAERTDASQAEDLLEPLERLGEYLDRVDLGRESTSMEGAVLASLVGDLVPAEAALSFEKASGPSDVRGRRVAEVALLEEGEDVWDIEVADNHTFVVHGTTVVHNCATLKDLGMGTTHWRNRGKALADAAAAPADDTPTQADMDGMCQELYDAAGGDLEQLLEMWFEHQQAMGDVPGKALTPDELRAEAQSLSRRHALRGSQKQADMADMEDEDDPAELLGQMISMAQDFIDDEDEAADVAAMREIMTILLRVQAGEAQETPDDTAEPTATAKAVREQVNEIVRHMGKDGRTSKLVVDLETLRVEHAEQTKQLEQATEDLEAARKQLAERATDADMLRRAGESVSLSAVRNTRRKRHDRHDAPEPPAEWIIPEAELAGAKDGELKSVWTTSYVNGLPDANFLHVEAGGEKDSDGKTVPRSLRMFPYKDASGQVDKPHLQNALARIPQSDLPQDVKDKLTARARNILDSQKALAVDPVAVDATGQEYHGARSVDPLVQQAHAMAIAWRGHGISRKATPQEPESRPQFDENALRDEMRALMFTALRT